MHPIQSFVRLCLLLAVACWSLAGTPVLAGPAAGFDTGQRVLALGPFAETLEDTTKSLDLAALSGGSHPWQPLGSGSLNPGFSASAWWLRVQVRNGGTRVLNALLDTGTPLVDYLDLHVVRADGSVQTIATGDRRPFATRPMDTRTFVLPLALAPGESAWIYLRQSTWDGLHEVIRLQLWNAQDYPEQLQFETLLFGLYFGTLGAILLYNLFLYLSTRERGFMLYLLYVTLFFVWSFAFRGYGLQYWWPQSPTLNNQALPVVSSLCYISFGLFALEYLKVKRDAPRWMYRANCTGILLNGFAMIPALFGAYSLAFACAVPTGAFMLAMALLTGSLLWRRGSRPARYFMLAFTLLALGVMLYYVQMLGWVSAGPLTEYGLQAGSSLEVLLLALGLADQMNTLKADKLRAEQQARAAQLALNTQLSIEVKQRTEELELANRRLGELAITDELTGAFNRRHFNQIFEAEFAAHRRQKTPFAFCMIDIDQFKPYNDLCGHQAGDDVLRQISQCLQEQLRRSKDCLFRLGGEEFAILLCLDQPPEKSLPYMEKLRQSIERLALPHPGNSAGVVTASFGLLTLDGASQLERSEDAYARADALLYQAKAAGRNCVMHANN